MIREKRRSVPDTENSVPVLHPGVIANDERFKQPAERVEPMAVPDPDPEAIPEYEIRGGSLARGSSRIVARRQGGTYEDSQRKRVAILKRAES